MWIISQSKKTMVNTDSGVTVGIGASFRDELQGSRYYIYVDSGKRNILGEYPSKAAVMAELEGFQRALHYNNVSTYAMTPGDIIRNQPINLC